MLSHTDCCEFSPKLTSGIAIIVGIEVVACSMSEKTDELIQFTLSDYDQNKEKENSNSYHNKYYQSIVRNRLK